MWWPAFGQFRDLHPEYEVFDFKDGHRYLDYAFIRLHLRLAIEIDGYGPHWRNQSRWQFSDQMQRQNHLIIDGWLVLRFSYDDICDKPRLCQQILQQFMGAKLGEENSVDQATFLEKEIVRLGKRLCRPITPDDVCHHFNIENKYARRLLQSLTEKQWIKPASGTIRVRSYELDLDGKSYTL